VADGEIATATTPPLVRPSQLARFWALSAETVVAWIRRGRLEGVRSPGNHFRVRVADVRAFCEREGMPVPPFVVPPRRRVVIGGGRAVVRRAVARALEGAAAGLVIDVYDDPYDAVVAAGSAPVEVVALGAGTARFDAEGAAAALERGNERVLVLVFGARGRARAEDVAVRIRELLGPEE